MLRIVLIALLAIVAASCVRPPLECRLEALTPSYLASCRVGTPDPYKQSFCGQQIVAQWRVDGADTVKISYVSGRHTLEQASLNVRGCKAIAYRLAAVEWRKQCGILTYKVELLSCGRCLYTYTPRNWVDWIED